MYPQVLCCQALQSYKLISQGIFHTLGVDHNCFTSLCVLGRTPPRLRESTVPFSQLFPGGTVVKTLPANTGNPGDHGSVPGCGRSPREGNGNLLSILAWKIPRRERPGRLQPMGSQRVRRSGATERSHIYSLCYQCILQSVMSTQSLFPGSPLICKDSFS